MNYYQDPFMQMPGEYPGKVPFYMTYPMQNVYLTEMEYEQDMERLKEMYPQKIRKLLEYVEDECDRMEYEGSLMFDEYPDRVMLRRIINRIYDAFVKPEDNLSDIQGMAARDQGLSDLIQVLLFNEMYKRRCRHRRCRRWW